MSNGCVDNSCVGERKNVDVMSDDGQLHRQASCQTAEDNTWIDQPLFKSLEPAWSSIVDNVRMSLGDLCFLPLLSVFNYLGSPSYLLIFLMYHDLETWKAFFSLLCFGSQFVCKHKPLR